MSTQIGLARQRTRWFQGFRRSLDGSDRDLNARKHPLRRLLPRYAFMLTLAATFALGYLLHDASSDARASSRWIEHTHRVLAEISAVESQLAQAESAMRGYVVSGNPGFLVQRETAASAIQDHIAAFERLAGSSADHVARIAVLRDRIAERMAIMEDTLRGINTGGAAAAVLSLPSAVRSSDGIYRFISEMQQVEESMLSTRQLDEEARYHRTLVLLIGAAVLACVWHQLSRHHREAGHAAKARRASGAPSVAHALDPRAGSGTGIYN